MSLLDFIRRRVGVGELVRRRVDWLPRYQLNFQQIMTNYQSNNNIVARVDKISWQMVHFMIKPEKQASYH